MSHVLNIVKTIKLYSGGEFIRGESGKFATLNFHNTDNHYAHVTIASRKDLRNSIENSHKAQEGWAKRTQFNKGQILYRMAEMMESKRAEFIQCLSDVSGIKKDAANEMMDGAIYSFVYYAGFADKYTSLIENVNPINGPYHNFTTSEAVGVVVHVPQDKFDLPKLCGELAAIICSGNSCLTLLPVEYWSILAPLSEMLATSDLPGGTINVLATEKDELLEWAAGHMEVNAVSFQNSNSEKLAMVKELGIDNMKRIISPKKFELGLDFILDHLEFKTSWHPVGF